MARRQNHRLEASQLLSCIPWWACVAHLAIRSCASACLQVRTGAVGGPQARRPPRVPDRGRGGTAGARLCAHQVRGTTHVLLLCTCSVGGSAKEFPLLLLCLCARVPLRSCLPWHAGIIVPDPPTDATASSSSASHLVLAAKAPVHKSAAATGCGAPAPLPVLAFVPITGMQLKCAEVLAPTRSCAVGNLLTSSMTCSSRPSCVLSTTPLQPQPLRPP